MKKYFVLLFVLSLFTFSCEQEDRNSNSMESDSNVNFERLTNSLVGFEKNGKIDLNVSDDNIMKTFKKFAFDSRLELEPESFELIKVDNQSYLRFYSKDHKASTIALIKGDDNQYRTGDTVCTSSACSACCGCLPNGSYCTECRPYGPNNPQKGDCTRSTGGGPVIE